jgi:hypothetical protein
MSDLQRLRERRFEGMVRNFNPIRFYQAPVDHADQHQNSECRYDEACAYFG